MQSPNVERDVHAVQLRKLRSMVNEKYPQLKVETLLMALNGTVETVS